MAGALLCVALEGRAELPPPPDAAKAAPACEIVRVTPYVHELRFAGYTAVVCFGPKPEHVAGVRSLRLKAAPAESVQDSHAVADWCYIGYGKGGNVVYWLMNNEEHPAPGHDWARPEVRRDEAHRQVVLSSHRRARGREALDVSIRYVFETDQPVFAATYTVRNTGPHAVEDVGGIVGLPGYPALDGLVAVGDDASTVRPAAPHRTFAEELKAGSRGRQLLKRTAPPYVAWAQMADANGAALRLSARADLPQGVSGTIWAGVSAERPGPEAPIHLEWSRPGPLGPGQEQAVTIRYRLERVDGPAEPPQGHAQEGAE